MAQELTKDYDKELFKYDFIEVNNNRKLYRKMTAIMDEDENTSEWRFDDWYNHYHNKYWN